MKYRLRKAELRQSLSKIEQRRWLFDNMPLDPTHAEWLRRRAWVRTVHGTTRIEGNTLSDIEVEALLTDAAAGRVSDREAREIIGTRKALELVDELVGRSNVAIDPQVMREIHRRVLWGQSPLLTPGEYRRGENRVVDADGSTIFTTPPSGDVPSLMDELGKWLTNQSGSLDAPTAAALAHLEFVAIHPFNYGNGRTARAISRLILARHGYAFDGLVSLDAQLDLDRAAYFAAIRAAVGRSYAPGYVATPFVRFFVDSLVQSADHVLERVRGLGLVMIAIRRAIASGSLPAPMIEGLAYAWINRHLRAGGYIRATGRSPQNTTRDLQRAVDDGWLAAAGERKARIYVLGPKLLEIPALGEIVSVPVSP
jgi:Fic family protein